MRKLEVLQVVPIKYNNFLGKKVEETKKSYVPRSEKKSTSLPPEKYKIIILI